MKGRATVDHILILKELVQIAKNNRKSTILTYLDVTKAYDKAWLDATLYVLHKQGVNNRLWKIVKKKTLIVTSKHPSKQSMDQHGKLRSETVSDKEESYQSANMHC